MTEQAHKNAVNINQIVAKYKKTGFLNRRSGTPKFGDFTNIGEFQDLRQRMINAENDFMSLPAYIRKRFNNDPGELIEFLNNPENRSECVEMGLIKEEVSEVLEEESSEVVEPNETN